MNDLTQHMVAKNNKVTLLLDDCLCISNSQIYYFKIGTQTINTSDATEPFTGAAHRSQLKTSVHYCSRDQDLTTAIHLNYNKDFLCQLHILVRTSLFFF